VAITDVARWAGHTTFTGRVLRFPLKLVPRNVVVPILTGINRGMRWITGAGPNRGCWVGNYEADHMFAIQKMVKPGTIVYDLGANAGFYTLAFSRLVGESGHVFSFEPEARNAYFLRRHIELNRLTNVTLVQVAVSASTGMVGFAGTSASGRIGGNSGYLVPTISLDEFIAAGNPAPSFVKMDVEGAEEMALGGATRLLSSAQPNWLMATHTIDLTRACKMLLSSHGYQMTAFDCETDAGNLGDFMAIGQTQP
jgi:FkbM family methyltransferase